MVSGMVVPDVPPKARLSSASIRSADTDGGWSIDDGDVADAKVVAGQSCLSRLGLLCQEYFSCLTTIGKMRDSVVLSFRPGTATEEILFGPEHHAGLYAQQNVYRGLNLRWDDNLFYRNPDKG